MSEYTYLAVRNIKATAPGLEEGLDADIPASGDQVGQLYLAYDSEILYRWDGSAWEIAIQGGGGGIPTIDQVLQAGNTTTRKQNFDDGAGTTLTLSTAQATFQDPAGNVMTILPSFISSLDGAGNQILIFGDNVQLIDALGNQSIVTALGLTYNQTGGDVIDISLELSTANRSQRIPNDAGDYVLKHVVNYVNAAFTGSVITIPHGADFTPSFATPVAKDAPTMGVLWGAAPAALVGFFIDYDATNIVITLNSAVVVAAAINIDVMFYK